MIKTKADIAIRVHADVMDVRLPREIDHHSAVRVRRMIDESICAHRPKKLRIDASGVDFMDSSGLGLLMGRLSLMKKLKGELILSHPSPAALRMVRLAGMERIITIETNK